MAPLDGELPVEYAGVLQEILGKIRTARLRTVLAANATMIHLYWEVGKSIAQRQETQGWGAKVIDRLAHDIKSSHPELTGFSPTNLKYMRRFAQECPDRQIGQQPADQLPWFHLVCLLTKVSEPAEREWYARMAIEQGWSRNILNLQISGEAARREGKAIHNFPATMPPLDSDLAAQVFKDPYLFDFLGTANPRNEREVELALVDHIQKFLLELGAGFAFVGRQVHLEVGERDFYLDLLFYHYKLRCFVVVELKAVPFDPAFVGTLNLYLSATDDLLKQPDDKPTIGLLLCRNKDKTVVEYALRGVSQPIGVAEWETQLTQSLPAELAASLPSVAELEAELQAEWPEDRS